MTSASGRRPLGIVVRWTLLILAALIGSTLLSTLLVLRCAPDIPAPPSPPAMVVDSIRDTTRDVQAEMRNVDYYVDPEVVLHIRSLRGQLESTREGKPPVFEDGTSYRMRIMSAEIMVDTTSLGLLINRYVFGYRGAPIRDLHLSVEGEDLIQKGKLGNVTFTIHSQVSLTPAGEIRLHPTDVKVLGFNADGLMKKLGIELDEMVKVQPNRGIRIEENDFLLDVAAILPPPRIRGRLSRVRLVPGGMVQTFGAGDSVPPRTAFGDSMPSPNFMYYHGASIQFGKLTMSGTDLLIVDADPRDRFGFFLGRYHEQLVAGTHRTTPSDGLVVRMPDLADLGQ
ncbi:MAG: hypothetical protein ABI679_12850 [Gemmatimonadota bacterium]